MTVRLTEFFTYSYFLEAHFVHYNDQFENFQQAMNSFEQDIAVVAALFEVITHFLSFDYSLLRSMANPEIC